MIEVVLSRFSKSRRIVGQIDLSLSHIPSGFEVEDKKGLSLDEELTVGQTNYRVSLIRNDWNGVMGPPEVPNPKKNYHVNVHWKEEKENPRDNGERYEWIILENFQEASNAYYGIVNYLNQLNKKNALG
jgi:hypothetical protein